MTQADLSPLEQLSAEQQAALSAEQQAIFLLMGAKDQHFFAETFTPADLPAALTRKGEIIAHSAAARARLERLKAAIALPPSAPIPDPAVNNDLEDMLTAVGATFGLGAAAAIVATDNTGHWQGVLPKDLVAPLEAEFGDKGVTDIDFDGSPDVLEGTVFISSGNRYVPALTIQLTNLNGGLEVKMGDLTSRGVIETLRGGADKVLRLAQRGTSLWLRRGRGNPADWLGMAQSAVDSTAQLADLSGNLRLKDRAWKVIQTSATAREKAYQDRLRQATEARYALEQAWDHYYNCPTCAVPFPEAASTCVVCGTARPPAPRNPDPRAH